MIITVSKSNFSKTNFIPGKFTNSVYVDQYGLLGG